MCVFVGAKQAQGGLPQRFRFAKPLDQAAMKLDHQFRQNDQFAVRYSLYDVSSANSRGAGALNAATASAGLDNTDQTIAFSNILTLSPRTV